MKVKEREKGRSREQGEKEKWVTGMRRGVREKGGGREEKRRRSSG